MNIQGIKLVTGEELVAKVKFVTPEGHFAPDGQITVEDPLLVRVSSGKDGLMVNFFPWTIINEGEMRIEATAIVSRFELPKDVQDAYFQNVSGIQIVSGAAPKVLLQG